MSTIQIQCDNCGAKYKLPESFSSPKAKCQKCGSVIDVASQRAAAEAGDSPAASTPAAAAKPAAAARPAVDRSKQTAGARGAKAASSKTGAAKAGGRASSRRRGGGDDGDDGDGGGRAGRRGRREPEKKNNNAMIFGGIGLAAVIVVVLVVVMTGGNGENGNQENTAQNSGTQNSGTQNSGTQNDNAAKPADDNGADSGTGNDDASKPDAGSKPEDGDAGTGKPDAGAAKPAEASTPKPDVPKNAPRWMKLKVSSMDEVDLNFTDVPWDRLSAEDQDKFKNLAADYAAGGRPGLDAQKDLQENPYEAMFGLIDYLRGLDHTDPFEMSQAYPINRFMTEITHGLSPGFVPVAMDETMDPRKAEHNADTTRAWLKFFDQHPDKATFESKNEERRKAMLNKDK